MASTGSALASVVMKTIRLHVELEEVVPAVTRLIDVPAGATLPELHDLLQAGMGWTDSHLHQFVAGDRRWGVPDDDSWDPAELDESAFKLSDLPSPSTYLYDFGDNWTHAVTILGSGGEQPGCPAGSGRCPPEDCGGASGYENLLTVLADPAHREYAELGAWAGELHDFDLARTDLQVRNTAGQVPASVRLVLDLAKDGVKLTPAGRLPRAFVRAVQELRPGWQLFDRPASREDDLIPLAALHDLLRKVGLLRLANGVARPTKIAADDMQVVRRLRSWFSDDEFVGILAGDVVSFLIAFGPQTVGELAARAFPMYGYWTVDGRPVSEQEIRADINRLQTVLVGLDQVETDWRTMTAGPSADSLLVRATALAAYWTRLDR